MKTIRQFLTTALALAVAFTFGGATCSAQFNNQRQQQFGLSTDFAAYLGLTTSQIDSISKNLLVLDYDWSEAVNNTVLLDQQIVALENDATQSPSAIGFLAGSYIQQKVTIARAIIAEVMGSNKALRALLTPAQQQKLAALQSAVQNAYNVLNMNGGAFFSNLFLEQYSVTGFDPYFSGPGSYPPPQLAPTALNQMFTSAVAQAHIQVATEQHARVREARMISPESR